MDPEPSDSSSALAAVNSWAMGWPSRLSPRLSIPWVGLSRFSTGRRCGRCWFARGCSTSRLIHVRLPAVDPLPDELDQPLAGSRTTNLSQAYPKSGHRFLSKALLEFNVSEFVLQSIATQNAAPMGIPKESCKAPWKLSLDGQYDSCERVSSPTRSQAG